MLPTDTESMDTTTYTLSADESCEHGWTGPWNSRPCGCGARAALSAAAPRQMATHRDYSDEELARALNIAARRRDAVRVGSDEYFTASAIYSTLLTEVFRRSPSSTTRAVTQGA